MGFEYANLSEVIAFEAEYRPNKKIKAGQGLLLELNQDIVTTEFLENSANALRQVIPDETEEESQSIETDAVSAGETVKADETDSKAKPEDTLKILRKSLSSYDESIKDARYMARILGGKPDSKNINDRVIRKWNLVRDGAPVEISFDEFHSWKISDLRNLYMFCLYEATAVKKKNSSK